MKSEIDKPSNVTGLFEPLRVLRCTRTRRYWSPDGWREQMAEASTFSDEIDAVRACVLHRLNDIELVVSAPSGAEIFSTPLR